ncbi:Stp1/IreP family PP2C-type Ser/Thr phosphatase [Psychrobacillus glaciei]|uniref:Stp1/IreP family PP2C-type Ser/Thr phosphatase n=1 Tax=Psychrobacillus glaciei TaxID=2283160 RepID=A0A5J6SKR0_9BACI|nr:Stp1/IreP family PP2C-type Ser/Thr phosphatase [Psychrobacillus glaciei]QFF98488.1 Stp1/IreP family PP2C-type Ser/Thr phosphatase [Psychrobacillus glaciei]
MKFDVKTDVGMKRIVNEDRVDVFVRPDGRVLAVIADGMGGHKAGDVASEIAITEFEKYFAAYNPSIVKAKDWLTYTFQSINQTIAKHSAITPGCEGMGTTLIAGLFEGYRGIIAHVGDSRVYQATPNGIRQITRDHSFVNVLIDSGEITEEQAKTHPKKNVLMKAVGTEISIQPDFYEVKFQPNSYFLFCTDGLSNKLSELFIHTTLYADQTIQEKSTVLVDEANLTGGEDNISLILLSNNDEEV